MKIFVFFELLVLFVSCVTTVLCKECTNTPPQLSSHTFRQELLSSNNGSWKNEMFSHYHLTPTDELAWANLLPRKILREEDEFSWAMMYKRMKNPAQFNQPGGFLKEVSLHYVRLDPSSMHWRAQQTNLEYLLMLDEDRLVWSFRKTAGLATPTTGYGGWEDPNSELRGHFVGLSSCVTSGRYVNFVSHMLAKWENLRIVRLFNLTMWASTHNDTLKLKMSAVVSALNDCQKKMNSGYLSAFPSEFFDRFEAVKPVWAPYYAIHKILAGLLDQYTLAGNDQALKMATWMADYFYNRVQNVILKYSIERHYYSLNEETGGMNDVIYKLYAITEDPKYILLAHLFDKPCFLGLLAVQADDISGFHSNTHIPVVIGAQMRYEITGDPLYKVISTYFMDIVNSSHSYATGGTSYHEFWQDPKRLASNLDTESEESCTTYNMLKVSRNLFRWTKEIAYADYYERALTNGVLGIQRGVEPGVMIYMLPLASGVSKAVSYHGWGTKFDSFWCCYGTGIESFSKLGDSIYFEEEGNTPGLYVIQYISSSIDWQSGKVVLTQKVDPVSAYDPYLRVTLTFSPKAGAGQSSTLNLRIPQWTSSNGAKGTLSGQSLSVPVPGNFLSITQKWNTNDKLTLDLPIILRTEAIKDDRPQYSSVQAIFYGQYLLAGHANGVSDIKTGSARSLSDWITPIPANYNNHLVTFSQMSGDSTFALSNSNHSITMEKIPESGTKASVHATFRLVLKDDSSSSEISTIEDFIGKSVMLEPFDSPGMLLSHKGTDDSFEVSDSSEEGSYVFTLVTGLSGKPQTVSLELGSKKGCFVYSGVNYKAGTELKLGCNGESGGPEFYQAASFTLQNGISKYHPISFVARGQKGNFIMEPLLNFRDESYSVYFNIKA